MTFLPMMVTMLMQAATPATAPAAVPEPDAASMNMAQIKAFNKTVAADHPHRITCRTIRLTGSLVKRGRACRTVAQWESIDGDGNAQARAIVEHSATRMSGQ
jgi:hypothetical protein